MKSKARRSNRHNRKSKINHNTTRRKSRGGAFNNRQILPALVRRLDEDPNHDSMSCLISNRIQHEMPLDKQEYYKQLYKHVRKTERSIKTLINLYKKIHNANTHKSTKNEVFDIYKQLSNIKCIEKWFEIYRDNYELIETPIQQQRILNDPRFVQEIQERLQNEYGDQWNDYFQESIDEIVEGNLDFKYKSSVLEIEYILEMIENEIPKFLSNYGSIIQHNRQITGK